MNNITIMETKTAYQSMFLKEDKITDPIIKKLRQADNSEAKLILTELMDHFKKYDNSSKGFWIALDNIADKYIREK